MRVLNKVNNFLFCLMKNLLFLHFHMTFLFINQFSLVFILLISSGITCFQLFVPDINENLNYGKFSGNARDKFSMM